MKNFKLDDEEKQLLLNVRNISDEVLLSWAGYSSKKDFEDGCEDDFSRELLILTNYEDILFYYKELMDLHSPCEQV